MNSFSLVSIGLLVFGVLACLALIAGLVVVLRAVTAKRPGDHELR